LDEDEFCDACKALAARYLKFKAANAGAEALKAFGMTLNEQFRFLAFDKTLQVDESSCTHDRHVCGHVADIDSLDTTALEDEDADSEAFRAPLSASKPPEPSVIYEIHLHPTYLVPCLWLTLKNLPACENHLDLAIVFKYLVPKSFQDPLRNAGPLGGLSIMPHPCNGTPTFSLHPCQTPDAMRPFQSTISDYLVIWLGLIGGSVSLYLPLEMGHLVEDAEVEL